MAYFNSSVGSTFKSLVGNYYNIQNDRDREAKREANERIKEEARARNEETKQKHIDAMNNTAAAVRALSDVIMAEPDNNNLDRVLNYMTTPPPQANTQVQQAKLRPMVDYSAIQTRSLTRGVEHQGGF